MLQRVLLVVALLVAGCMAVQGPGPFPFVGKFDDYNETITGEVRSTTTAAFHTSPRRHGNRNFAAKA